MAESNRTILQTAVAKVPKIFTPENRGFSQCCEPFQVLFDASDTASYKNDITSAWSLGDTVTFTLKKDGVVTTYTPSAVAFPNEPNAYYTTILWRDVYLTDGIGCYELYVGVDYAGLTAEKLWGKYDVQPYQIGDYFTGKGTVRLKSYFNDVNTFEGINFTGAYVVDTLRFKGKFGYWNDLTDVDNVQYTDAERTKVRRENLTEYELRVDLHTKCIIDRLRFHLVAENACYISDHNADNYSYEYLDWPVIVKEGFNPNWFDGTRRVKGVAKFEDKQKMTKTHFQDNDTPGSFEMPPNVNEYATVENSDTSYTASVAGGQTLVLPDTIYNINFNGVLQNSVTLPSVK